MAIFLRFRIFKKIRKIKSSPKSARRGDKTGGAPYPPGAPLWLVATSYALRAPFSCGILLLVDKNSLYNLPKVLTTVPCKNPLFLFRVVFLTDLDCDDVPKRPPRTRFLRGSSTLTSRRCCNTLKPLRCGRGCCTSAMLKGRRRPEAWRQGSKQWSSKSSSAKGWWNADSTPIT